MSIWICQGLTDGFRWLIVAKKWNLQRPLINLWGPDSYQFQSECGFSVQTCKIIQHFVVVKSHPSTCEKSEPCLKCFSMIGFPPITNQTISFLQKQKYNSSWHLFTNLVENGVCFNLPRELKGWTDLTVFGLKLHLLVSFNTMWICIKI